MIEFFFIPFLPDSPTKMRETLGTKFQKIRKFEHDFPLAKKI